MIDPFPQVGPETYVRVAHFAYEDDAALFGALDAVDGAVEIMIVENPDNPLLERHAETQADENIEAVRIMEARFPGSHFANEVNRLFAGDEAKATLIEDELTNLRSILGIPGMGLVAIIGTKKDVAAYTLAHLEQPH